MCLQISKKLYYSLRTGSFFFGGGGGGREIKPLFFSSLFSLSCMPKKLSRLAGYRLASYSIRDWKTYSQIGTLFLGDEKNLITNRNKVAIRVMRSFFSLYSSEWRMVVLDCLANLFKNVRDWDQV